jgi:hypothetical protein
VEAIFQRVGRPMPVIGEDDATYRAREEAQTARMALEARRKAAQDQTRARATRAAGTAMTALHRAKIAVNGPMPPTPDDQELARAHAVYEAQRAAELERWETEEPDYWREPEAQPKPRLPPDYDDGSCEWESRIT